MVCSIVSFFGFGISLTSLDDPIPSVKTVFFLIESGDFSSKASEHGFLMILLLLETDTLSEFERFAPIDV